MNTYSELLEIMKSEREKQRAREAKILKLARALEKPENSYFNTYSTIKYNEVTFFAHSLDSLHKIRRFLKSLWPDYTDKLIRVSAYKETGLAVYETSIDPEIQILLRMPVSDFPTLKEGCHFKEVPLTDQSPTKWVYVCDNKEDQE